MEERKNQKYVWLNSPIGTGIKNAVPRLLEGLGLQNYKNISILSASRELNTLIYKIYDKMKEVNVELYLRYNLNLIKDEFDYIIIDN